MDRTQVTEFHFIVPIETVPSILEMGLLSHNRAKRVAHTDISMSEAQDLRAKKIVFGGLHLHDYANLYFNGRNKMMAKRRPLHDTLCVLRIRPDVLDLPGAIIADQNAASKYALFLASPAGLKKLSYDEVFVRSWKCPDDQIREWRLGSAVCAELLIPHQLPPQHLFGAYVLNETARARFLSTGAALPCEINPDLFLR